MIGSSNNTFSFLTSLVFGSLVVGSLIFASGCGKSPTDSALAENTASSNAKKEITAAVKQFLNAVREGKDEEIFKMLTPKAREVCGKDKLPSVPASDTADFRIDMIKVLNSNEAQAQTTMIDVDLKGNQVEDTLAWALRKTEEGWKIAGTACVFFEGMDPVVVNFESKDAIAQAEAQFEQQKKEMYARLEQMRQINSDQQPSETNAQQPQASGQQPNINR